MRVVAGAGITGAWKAKTQSEAFTRFDLLAVVFVLSLFAAVTVSALAGNSARSGRLTCFNNKRQLQTAALIYSAEWNDYLMPSSPIGYGTYGWCPDNGAVNWTSDPGNTNPITYQQGALGPYLKDVSAYKCPHDTLTSDNGPRIRSVSVSGAMVGQISDSALMSVKSYLHYIPLQYSWRIYIKAQDLATPGSANLWVFCDESMFTLNDGYQQCDLDGFRYPDVPAYYDEGGNCFSFADGHVEFHKWLVDGSSGYGILSAPYKYRVSSVQGAYATGPSDPDYKWLRQHTSSKVFND